MVVGVKLRATPVATRSRPGRTATTYPDPVGTYASQRWPAARTTSPRTRLRTGPMASSTRGSTVNETANPASDVGTMARPACCGDMARTCWK